MMNTQVTTQRNIKPSERGELEITDLNKVYLNKGSLNCEHMSRGYTWLDTGTHESLVEAAQFVQTMEKRQGIKIACPEEIAYNNNWINSQDIYKLASQ